MMPKQLRMKSKRRGSALITCFMFLLLLSLVTLSYMSTATQTLREAQRQRLDVTTSDLCDAGIQVELENLWTPFQATQNFTAMDAACTGAGPNSPVSTYAGAIPNVGNYSVGVVSYTVVDSYDRQLKIRAVGWLDTNQNGQVDANEPQEVVDTVVTYSLQRSPVFDYTYFINNYGWMEGFGQNDLWVNGDMRANGDLTISNGSPTINGSVIANHNPLLSPTPVGQVNTPPVKWSDATYNAMEAGQARWRPGYDSSFMGAKNSATYAQWQGFDFESTGSVVNNTTDGAIMGGVNGLYSWDLESAGANPTTTLIDTSPTQTIVMPDLNNISYYENESQSYSDPLQTYNDGTANPNYGKGAYLQTWNAQTNSYQTVTTNGVLTGSVAIIGSAAHPILIHGPVTVTQDVVVEGNITGQGTVYAGRNVHVVGSIIYQNPPNFQGSNQTAVNNANQKADLVAFAATGSVIMGDTSQFGYYPLTFMEPPFTSGRYDSNGNWIPPFNATNVDSTGNMLYQSVLGDAYIHSIATSVDQMDAILYANNTGGGNLATDGGGIKLNGSIITKDEAMVTFSLPMQMNYDSRIREKALTTKPLIDVNLPRSPAVINNAWQNFGLIFNPGS